MSTRTKNAPTLQERIRDPGFAESVTRHRAKLDAEDLGWVVIEPARARALLAVAREAKKFAEYWDHWGPRWRPLQNAVDRLDRVSRGGR